MLENSNHQEHLEWVKKCINSCTKIEQLENCNSLVGSFIFRLKRDGLADNIVDNIENDLFQSYVYKEGFFIIPKCPYDKKAE
jgi:hypothetical protein